MTAAWSRLDRQAFYDERAAIAEFDHQFPRAEAERLATSQLYDALQAHPPLGILQELAAADRVRHSPQLAGILETLGLVGVRAPAWGFGWATFTSDATLRSPARWRPADPNELGTSVVIVPAIEDGRVVDLVTADILGKHKASRLGVAGIVGFDEIARARASARPVLVFDGPLRWLRGGCLGIFVVDWQRALSDLGGVQAFLCGSNGTADRLRRATAHFFPAPAVGIVRKKREPHEVSA